MTATVVNNSNLLSESWQNIYDIINNKSNVTDPTTPATEKRKWVYSRVPVVKAVDFKGFPFIVIHPSTIDFGDTQSANRQTQTVSFSIEVEVFTCDRGFGNQDAKGMSQLDAISDDILQSLNAQSSRNTLSGNGLYFIKPNATTVSSEEFDNTLIYRRSFIVALRGYKKVY